MSWGIALFAILCAALVVAISAVERRRTAKELNRLLNLERESHARTSAQNEALRALDQVKDDFVASVSHEFRTPLTSINGFLELLLDDQAVPFTEQQQRFLSNISRSTQRLTRLVDDLLFTARSDAGGASLTIFSELDLADLVSEVGEVARPDAETKGIELTVESEADLWVAADPIRMSQLLDNLVSNAVKFTPDGGSVAIGATRSTEEVIITVTDNGIGIPRDEQPHLFERFFRSRIAIEQAIGGTGLGLAITKSIADDHGASITVDSELGEGTSFRLAVPLHMQTSRIRQAAHAAETQND